MIRQRVRTPQDGEVVRMKRFKLGGVVFNNFWAVSVEQDPPHSCFYFRPLFDVVGLPEDEYDAEWDDGDRWRIVKPENLPNKVLVWLAKRTLLGEDNNE